MFYLHHDDQTEGPYSESELKSIFVTRQLPVDAQVCREDGSWIRYADMFKSDFSPPPPPSKNYASPAVTTDDSVEDSAASEPEVLKNKSDLATAGKNSAGLSRTDFGAMLLGAILFAGLMGFMISPESTFIPGIVLIHSGCRRFQNMGWNSFWGLLWIIPVMGAWSLLCTIPMTGTEALVCLIATLIAGPALAVLCLFRPSGSRKPASLKRKISIN